MQSPEIPFKKELVLIGGGHSHVQVLKKIAMKGGIPGVRITMISDASVAYYSGMLPGCLAELYTPEEIQMELRALARWTGTRFILAPVTGLDPDLKQITFNGRPPLSFDVASINIGSISRGMDIPGVSAHAIATRPINKLIDKIARFETDFSSATETPRVVVVGGGAAGVELAFAMYNRWTRRYGDVDITLIDSQEMLLTGHGNMVRRLTHRILQEKKIRLISDVRVKEVRDHLAVLDDEETVAFDLLLWATGGAPSQVIQNMGLRTDNHGFIEVDSTLQTIDYPYIFAAGDCIHFRDHPLPKAGVYAVREGPVLAHNLHAYLTGASLQPYKPQSAILALLMTGDFRSIVSWRSLGLAGKWAWQLKDWIDRGWMDKFDPANFGPMPEPSPSKNGKVTLEDDPMRCGGCGAKVGSGILTGVLDSLTVRDNPRVHVGISHPDDAAVVSIPEGMRLVQTVDYFKSFIDDPYLFGRIAILHAASDLYAMGAQPDTALIVATLPYAEKQIVASDLSLLMAGAVDEANRIGATVTGGHTSEGAELSIGVVMNGLTSGERIFRKSGLREGDRLVLTKPLGTGTLLAADMRYQAKGWWIDNALDQMLVSSEKAAGIFADKGVSAVTDITGFGLAGHLAEMLEESGAGAEISLAALPRLPGVTQCLDDNIISTLAPANREHLEKRWQIKGISDNEILFDPQTSGGLLAGIPQDMIDEVLEELNRNGYPEAVEIGTVTSEKRTIRLTD